MAAVSEIALPRIVELRQLRAADLNSLLEEETQTWERKLDWDFRASAGLVRRFLDLQALSGYALVIDGHPVGYSYYVCEERKGLIGDLYVMERYASPENESRLLTAAIEALMKTPYVRRIESQLMMLRARARLVAPASRFLKTYERNFMELELESVARLPVGKAGQSIVVDNWTERKQDEAAALIANAYQGHVDSDINDQYRSSAGARRFLLNIVQYPGCGSFFQPASYLAVEAKTTKLCGLCLSSLVHADIGHITQVCVSKAVRGAGAGYELMRQSLESLARHGCRKASLTVTAGNTEAIALYDRMGFRKTREFTAFVWEGF